MKQTFRGESPFELWRKFRAFVPERRKAAAEPAAPTAENRQDDARSRLPERNESFYWSFGMYSHW
jgi:hypothetical protein